MNCLSFSCNFLFPIFCRRTTSGSLFSLSPFFQSLCRHSPLILSRVSFREMFSWELSMVLNKRRKDGLQVTSGYELKLSSLFLLCKLNAREQNSKHNENTQSVLSLGICIDDHSLQIMNKSRFFLLRHRMREREWERKEAFGNKTTRHAKEVSSLYDSISPAIIIIVFLSLAVFSFVMIINLLSQSFFFLSLLSLSLFLFNLLLSSSSSSSSSSFTCF